MRHLADLRTVVDDLTKDLMERAGLSEAQAKAAAEVVAKHLRDEQKRKKVVTAAMAATVASAVVTTHI
jgi:hypothetical protein